MTLADLRGLGWNEAKRALEENLSLLALSDDEETRECATAIRDYGIECGAAILCAVLYCEENGVDKTLSRGIQIYEDLIPRLKTQGSNTRLMESRLQNLRYWMAWIREDFHEKERWPLRFPCRKTGKKAGLANIMLLTGIRRMPCESNSQRIVANFVVRFLQEGMEQKA